MDLLKYSEDSGVSRVENVRRAHLSIELGHFHLREFTGKSSGEIEILLQRQLVRAAPLGEVIRQTAICGTSTPRVSTCFLLDDYFGDDVLEPESILVPLLKVADELGIRIDYVGREAACAVTRDGVKLGEIVAGMVQGEPPRGTTGARPPAQDSGWLCNGERAQNEAMAMRLPATRQFPEEYGIDTKNSHSIFVDIEMWRDPAPGRKSEPGRRWSCSFLAAIWYLLRLGMLRDCGKAVAVPERWVPGSSLPSQWSELPTIMQLTPAAAPFAAFRTASILPREFLKIEHAVQVILDHLVLDSEVVEQSVSRAKAEGIDLPLKVTDRLSQLFIEGP